MADQKNIPEEPLKTPERRASAPTEETRFDWEREKVVEKKEVSPDEKIVSEELRREIELMELDDSVKGEAKAKANKISFLGDKEKIEHLLKIAREKGVVYAIQIAKQMNEPYLLDILHDTLAREGFYKDFTK